MAQEVELARAAFDRRAWGEAHRLLAREEDLVPSDLRLLAIAAQLLGLPDESDRAWERAHAAYQAAGDREGAALCAFWLGLDLMLRGEMARCSGWRSRAERLVAELGPTCAARAYLLVPTAVEALMTGRPAEARAMAAEVVEVAEACGDPDLLAFGVLASGQAALALGESERGMRCLDEVMVAVTTGEVSPIPAGIVYCAVLEACSDTFDLQRAGVWTEEFHAWCEQQPDLVPYRGQCLVHRAEVLHAHGGWGEAATELERATRLLSEPLHPALGFAFYVQGDLHRLRGDEALAEEAYRLANEHGRDPQPGLALLRLAQGRVDAAAAAIRRSAGEEHRLDRPRVLAAAVEILLATGDDDGARRASAELSAAAVANPVPLLAAMAAYARGCVLGPADPGALPELRRACSGWLEVGMTYDAARARVQAAAALRALGDQDAADLELDAARAAFERVGARPDLARLDGPSTESGLSAREQDVLRHLASGQTNREIAGDLTISEHTVARHVQNIFAKLGVSSRSAATAYAYEHGLV